MTKEEKKLVVTDGELRYYVVCDNGEERRYGIYAELENNIADCECVRKIFFTEDEAVHCCKWLCKNRVYPIAISDVLRNVI